MSKYLKADEEQHHYETEIHQKTMHEINRVNTFRTMSNEYQDIIQSKYADDLISHNKFGLCLLYTSPSPRDQRGSRMPSSA